jgi:hypothetical protein
MNFVLLFDVSHSLFRALTYLLALQLAKRGQPCSTLVHAWDAKTFFIQKM